MDRLAAPGLSCRVDQLLRTDTVREGRRSMETACGWFVSRVQVVSRRLHVATHLVSSEVASVECTNTPCAFIAATFN